MREAAPDWYEARKQELGGKGYPKLGNVPVDATYRDQKSGLVRSAAERETIRKAFFADPRSEPVNVTPAQILAWSARLRRNMDARNRPGKFLTDDDIRALHARFDRPRARR